MIRRVEASVAAVCMPAALLVTGYGLLLGEVIEAIAGIALFALATRAWTRTKVL